MWNLVIADFLGTPLLRVWEYLWFSWDIVVQNLANTREFPGTLLLGMLTHWLHILHLTGLVQAILPFCLLIILQEMFTSLEWVCGILFIFITATIASSAGTGGGALYMPTFIFLLNNANQAVPLSKASILGVAIASFFSNVTRRHPTSRFKRRSVW